MPTACAKACFSSFPCSSRSCTSHWSILQLPSLSGRRASPRSHLKGSTPFKMGIVQDAALRERSFQNMFLSPLCPCQPRFRYSLSAPLSLRAALSPRRSISVPLSLRAALSPRRSLSACDSRRRHCDARPDNAVCRRLPLRCRGSPAGQRPPGLQSTKKLVLIRRKNGIITRKKCMRYTIRTTQIN